MPDSATVDTADTVDFVEARRDRAGETVDLALPEVEVLEGEAVEALAVDLLGPLPGVEGADCGAVRTVCLLAIVVRLAIDGATDGGRSTVEADAAVLSAELGVLPGATAIGRPRTAGPLEGKGGGLTDVAWARLLIEATLLLTDVAVAALAVLCLEAV